MNPASAFGVDVNGALKRASSHYDATHRKCLPSRDRVTAVLNVK